MDTEPSMAQKVSPEALALNRSCQQTPMLSFLDNECSQDSQDLDPPSKLVRIEDPVKTETSMPGSTSTEVAYASPPTSNFSTDLSVAVHSQASVFQAPEAAPGTFSTGAAEASSTEESVCLKREHTGEQKMDSSRCFTLPTDAAAVTTSASQPLLSSAGVTTTDQQIQSLLNQKDSLQPGQIQALLSKLIPEMSLPPPPPPPAAPAAPVTTTSCNSNFVETLDYEEQKNRHQNEVLENRLLEQELQRQRNESILDAPPQQTPTFGRSEKPMDTSTFDPFENLQQTLDKLDSTASTVTSPVPTPQSKIEMNEQFKELLSSLEATSSTFTSVQNTSVVETSCFTQSPPQPSLMSQASVASLFAPVKDKPDYQQLLFLQNKLEEVKPSIQLSTVDQRLLQSLVSQQSQVSAESSQPSISQPALQQLLSHLPSNQVASSSSANTIIVPMIVNSRGTEQQPATGFQMPTLLPQTISSNSTMGAAFMTPGLQPEISKASTSSTPIASHSIVNLSSILQQQQQQQRTQSNNTPIVLLAQGQTSPSIIQVAQPSIATLNGTQFMIASPQVLSQLQSAPSPPPPAAPPTPQFIATSVPAQIFSSIPCSEVDLQKAAASPQDATQSKKQDTILYHLLTEEERKSQMGNNAAAATAAAATAAATPNNSTGTERLPSLTVDEVDLLLMTANRNAPQS